MHHRFSGKPEAAKRIPRVASAAIDTAFRVGIQLAEHLEATVAGVASAERVEGLGTSMGVVNVAEGTEAS